MKDIVELDNLKFPGYEFLFVYILQAHSKKWPVGSFSHVEQPDQLAGRAELAKKFQMEYKIKMPLVLDNMDNTFNTAFGAWPHKMFIIKNKKIQYIEPWTKDGIEIVSKPTKLVAAMKSLSLNSK